jgi:hypothetical protein
MLVVVALVLGVQVSFVQVVGVPFVAHARVTALLVVDVWVPAMGLVAHVRTSSSDVLMSVKPCRLLPTGRKARIAQAKGETRGQPHPLVSHAL